VLVCFWSPKGGSGTSVVAASAAFVLSRDAAAVRVADLTGDQPAVLAIANEPPLGLRDWLRAGVDAPIDAIERLAVDVGRGVTLLPAGSAGLDGVAPEAGAALAVALQSDARPTMCDGGRLDVPATRALAEVADASVMVVRGCYLALRRAVQHEAVAHTDGVVLIDEHGRSLGAHDVAEVVGLPVLATIEARTSTARVVDAGVLPNRVPDSVARPMRAALARIGCFDDERAA
jgi:hypothetical protein